MAETRAAKRLDNLPRKLFGPLPVSDQVRLADMIMENFDSERRSAKSKRSVIDILESIEVEPIFRTSAEVDEYKRKERDSWDG